MKFTELYESLMIKKVINEGFQYEVDRLKELAEYGEKEDHDNFKRIKKIAKASVDKSKVTTEEKKKFLELYDTKDGISQQGGAPSTFVADKTFPKELWHIGKWAADLTINELKKLRKEYKK